MSEEFIRQGLEVLGCGRSQATVSQLRSSPGRPHDFAVVDVASDDEVMSWARRLLREFGPPDLLLNNAALINRNASLWKTGAREFSEVIYANIKGVAIVIRHFLPAMVERQSGVVVNASSGWWRPAASPVAPDRAP